MQPSGNSHRETPVGFADRGLVVVAMSFQKDSALVERATSYRGLRRKSCQRCGLLSSAWLARAANCVCVYRTRTQSQATSKLAQWVEQRSHKPSVVGSTPMLAPALKRLTCDVDSGGLRPASRCPGGLAAECCTSSQEFFGTKRAVAAHVSP
jgi:hypothetical protein